MDLVFDDGHAGLGVWGLNIGQQAPFEPGLQTVIQPQHLFGRPVGGENDLALGLIQRVEGMEHLLLGGSPSGHELHVIHEEDVGGAVLVPELLVASLPNGLDQLVGEGIPFYVDHRQAGFVLMDRVGDGVEQVGLAQTGLPVDVEGVDLFLMMAMRVS